MINLIQSAKNELSKKIESAYNKAFSAGAFTIEIPCAVTVEEPKDKAHGDFSTNFCMQATRTLKMPPRQIAQIILDNICLDGTYFESAQIAGPGFINFYLGKRWLCESLLAIMQEGKDYGHTDYGQDKKIIVEFVSANPTGPMHIGNARGGAIGDCLASVLECAGFSVTREFYINDAGNQIEKFFRSLDARYKQALLGEDACEFPEDGYKGDDIKERVNEFIKINGDRYLNANEDERRDALVSYALEKNISSLKEDLGTYRINYDYWFRESSLYENGDVEETLEILKKNGYTYENEGALWFKSSAFGCDKDEVLIRQNGLCTYFAADIAYHRNKFSKRGFEKAIDIWGADHHGHVARLKAGLSALGIDADKLDVILMQLVRLVRGSEIVRLSKRSGKAISLRDLLDETSVDAARFFFNLRQSDSHFDFDLDLAIEETSQNPVYYVQYAHARICSILRLLEKEGININIANVADLSVLTQPEERALIVHLAYFPEEVRLSAIERDPSRITRYAIETASLFHKFYNACRVNCDDETTKFARLALILCVKTVLNNTLSILSISAPEKM